MSGEEAGERDTTLDGVDADMDMQPEGEQLDAEPVEADGDRDVEGEDEAKPDKKPTRKEDRAGAGEAKVQGEEATTGESQTAEQEAYGTAGKDDGAADAQGKSNRDDRPSQRPRAPNPLESIAAAEKWLERLNITAGNEAEADPSGEGGEEESKLY